MRVSAFEPPSRWHVQSEARPAETHLVDVLAFAGFGECSCEHFQYRLLPALQTGTRPLLPRCKHIEAARDSFADFMVKLLNDARK